MLLLCSRRNFVILSLIGIIWELINCYLLRTFCHLGSFCVVSSFTTFWPNFTSGLLQVILPRPRIGMLSLVTVSPVITAFHSCCLSHHVFDQVNLCPAWVGFETAIFWQCSPGTVIGEAAKHPLWLNNFVQCRRLTVCSSIAAAAWTQWGKQSN